MEKLPDDPKTKEDMDKGKVEKSVPKEIDLFPDVVPVLVEGVGIVNNNIYAVTVKARASYDDDTMVDTHPYYLKFSVITFPVNHEDAPKHHLFKTDGAVSIPHERIVSCINISLDQRQLYIPPNKVITLNGNNNN